VDNACSGGFFVNVDLETGRLEGKGFQFLRYGREVFVEHPDTKVVLGGRCVPYFKEAINLVKAALALLPAKIVGWDVAVSEDGPVLVEANFRPMLTMSDTACGGYRKNPVMKMLLDRRRAG
jgi:hypothetical protein